MKISLLIILIAIFSTHSNDSIPTQQELEYSISICGEKPETMGCDDPSYY